MNRISSRYSTNTALIVTWSLKVLLKLTKDYTNIMLSQYKVSLVHRTRVLISLSDNAWDLTELGYMRVPAANKHC